MHDARHDPDADGTPRGYSVIDDWALRNGQANYYSLRAPADLHPLTDIDALRQLCYQQAEAITYLAARVTQLETHVGALLRTVEHHGDSLQVLTLRGAP